MKELNIEEQKTAVGGFKDTVYCAAYDNGCTKGFVNSKLGWKNGKGSFSWWLPSTYVTEWYKYYYDGAMPCYEWDCEHI